MTYQTMPSGHVWVQSEPDRATPRNQGNITTRQQSKNAPKPRQTGGNNAIDFFDNATYAPTSIIEDASAI